MSSEFPAAHSMDTTWFAVDQDGNVGRFETGEDGAVPNDAPCAGNIDTIDEFWIYAAGLVDAMAAAPALAREFDRDERAMFIVEPVVTDAVSSYRTHTTSSTVEELVLDRVVVRESGPRVIATKNPVSPKTLAAIAAHPDVRILWTTQDIYDRLEEGTWMYVYGNGDEPGAYARREAPTTTLKVSALPEPLRGQIGMVLPVRFADAAEVHLADFMKDEDAQMWGEGISLRGEPKDVPLPPPKPAPRKVDWIRIGILLAAVIGIAYLVSRR